MKKVQVVVQVTDDLDGSKATASHVLALDDRVVEIDLNADHDRELLELLEPYLKAGHKPGETTTSHPGQAHRGRRNGAYYAGLQAFLDERGLKYRTSGGNVSYKPRYHQLYAEHLAQTAA